MVSIRIISLEGDTLHLIVKNTGHESLYFGSSNLQEPSVHLGSNETKEIFYSLKDSYIGFKGILNPSSGKTPFFSLKLVYFAVNKDPVVNERGRRS